MHAPMWLEDNIDALRAAYDAAIARRTDAEYASRGADDAGDMAEYERAEAAFRDADNETELLAEAIDEWEVEAEFLAGREDRRAYWQGVL